MTQLDLATPGPGWRIIGADRGAGQPPAPPPRQLTDGLLDGDQAAALGDYADICAVVARSRAEEVRLRGELDHAQLDDLRGAADALAARVGTAPPSVVGQRQAAFDAQVRYTQVALWAAAEALDALHAALAAPAVLRRLTEVAWGRLADERKREPARMRTHAVRLLWVLELPERLSPNPASPALRTLDALPALGYEDALSGLLDEIAAAVAGQVAALDALEKVGA